MLITLGAQKVKIARCKVSRGPIDFDSNNT